MRKVWMILLAMAVTLGLSSIAYADKGGHGGGHGNGKGHDSVDTDHTHGHGHGHDADDDDHHGPSNRPAGWDHGKKTGWGDCDMPPGLAKKNGCNSRYASDDDYYRHHPHDRDYRRHHDVTTHHTYTHHTYTRTTTPHTAQPTNNTGNGGIILQRKTSTFGSSQTTQKAQRTAVGSQLPDAPKTAIQK